MTLVGMDNDFLQVKSVKELVQEAKLIATPTRNTPGGAKHKDSSPSQRGKGRPKAKPGKNLLLKRAVLVHFYDH